jgi:hypothetical protein
MNTQTRKAKGRSLVLEVREWLLKLFPEFQDNDIVVPTTSQPGEDIKFSPEFRKIFPYSIECKRQEGLSKVYSFMEQAEANATHYTPIVIMRSNHKEALVVMKLTDFSKLVGT